MIESSINGDGVVPILAKNKGRWYWEVFINRHNNTSENYIGICEVTKVNGNTSNLSGNGQLFLYGAPENELNEGSVIGVAVDLSNGICDIFCNGELKESFTDVKMNGEFYPYLAIYDGNFTFNFGATPFQGNVPEGYLPYDYDFADPINIANLKVLLNAEEKADFKVLLNKKEEYHFVNWSSEDEVVAEVNEFGLVTAKSEGEAKIFAYTEDGIYKDYIIVKVLGKIAPQDLQIVVKIKVGEDGLLFLNNDLEKITWTSKDETVAIVDTKGLVKGIKKGVTTVIALYENKEYEIVVYVV